MRRVVFITGATGVVGCEIVPRLLADAETEVRLLIRARDAGNLQERFDELLAYWGDAFPDPALRRTKLLRGDVCRPRFDLPAAEYEVLARETTNVVHAAGNVKLNQSLAEARQSAVVGLQQILAFCRAAKESGGFQKLDDVSTIGVAGRMRGLIPERRLTESRKFHNTYEQSKSEAEDLLFGEMQNGLTATVHRPSMVVGDSQTGKILRYQVFYHLCEFLSGRRTRGFVPELGAGKLDVVPVDFVAGAIAWSATTMETAGRVLHLCAGPDESVRLDWLRDEARRIFESHSIPVPRLRGVRAMWLRPVTPALSLLARRHKWRALRSLPGLLRYLQTCQTQSFTVAETHELLQRGGAEFTGSGQSLAAEALKCYSRFRIDQRKQQSPAAPG